MSYNSEYVKRRYIWLKLRALEYKGNCCEKCGYNEHYGALEFHHRNTAAKEFSWNRLRCKSWHIIVKELDKCDLLCANCHREAHADPSLEKHIREWRQIIDDKRQKKPDRQCDRRGCSERSLLKFCSQRCSRLAREVIDWPQNLPTMVKETSQRQVARLLGVSDKAVEKRLRNHHL